MIPTSVVCSSALAEMWTRRFDSARPISSGQCCVERVLQTVAVLIMAISQRCRSRQLLRKFFKSSNVATDTRAALLACRHFVVELPVTPRSWATVSLQRMPLGSNIARTYDKEGGSGGSTHPTQYMHAHAPTHRRATEARRLARASKTTHPRPTLYTHTHSHRERNRTRTIPKAATGKRAAYRSRSCLARASVVADESPSCSPPKP